MRVATDIGGTFTDLVCFNSENELNPITISKSSTTPGEFEKGIMNALSEARIDPSEVQFFAHGTTVVINAITERKGSKTALITTKGFRDVLEIARGTRPDLYNFNFKKQEPFVPRHLRLEIDERLDFQGNVLRDLDTTTLKEQLDFLKNESVETIAICFLHAYENPIHEQQLSEAIKKSHTEFDVICSHEVSREWREYERTSSTVLSAYVKPTTNKYLNELSGNLKKMGYKSNPFIMQSNGGITTIDHAKENPIVLVESGPASGMIGGVELGKAMNKKNLIILDIGGTTAKCSLIDNGVLKISSTYNIEKSRTQAGYPILTPVIDIVEIGNGGGSICWIDNGGKLHVGPKSAGASPGPSSYGNGGKYFTTTDANVVCNRIAPQYFMGGTRKPDMGAVIAACSPITEELGLSVEEIARGVIRVANANMVNALKSVSVNKGYDPRDFSLLVIGGGGPLHGAYLAKELEIPEVIIPVNAGVFSAFGMLMSDLRRDYFRTHIIPLNQDCHHLLTETFEDMAQQAVVKYKEDNYEGNEITFEYYLDIRYEGQEHFVKVKMQRDTAIEEVVNSFHHSHNNQYSFRLDDTPAEIVNFHLVASVEVSKPLIPEMSKTGHSLEDALVWKELVDFDEFGKHHTPFFEREKLNPGTVLNGPAIVVEATTSSVIPPEHQLTIDKFGSIIISQS